MCRYLDKFDGTLRFYLFGFFYDKMSSTKLLGELKKNGSSPEFDCTVLWVFPENFFIGEESNFRITSFFYLILKTGGSHLVSLISY